MKWEKRENRKCPLSIPVYYLAMGCEWREKALMIDRMDVLRNANFDTSKSQAESDSLTFVTNHDKKGSS